MTEDPTWGMDASEKPHPQKLCIVDVCGTLYNANTTAGFVRFYMDRRFGSIPWGFRLLETLRRTGLRKAVILLGRLLGRDLFREGYIKVLKGEEMTALRAVAVAYVATLETDKRIAPVHARLSEARAEGWELLLVSNSLDVVIAEVAHCHEVPWLASRLATRNGNCLGYLAEDLKGRKRRAAETWLGRPLDQIETAVLTDNKSDKDVIAVARQVTLVSKGPPRTWMQGIEADVISH